MKAIHNKNEKIFQCVFTVFNTSKIQNESNSQLVGKCSVPKYYCVQYVKDTK